MWSLGSFFFVLVVEGAIKAQMIVCFSMPPSPAWEDIPGHAERL